MKFNEYVYTRPDYEVVEKKIKELNSKIENATRLDEVITSIKGINVVKQAISTAENISSIRHTIDTRDEFYQKENDFWDEVSPLFQQLNTETYKIINKSKFRSELENHFPKQYFTLMDFALKEMSPEIIEDLQEENRYSSEYTKLIASAKIIFRDIETNLAGLGKYTTSSDRTIRAEANAAKYKFFTENESKIDEIFDKLVKVRDRIAKKLGFKNFVELGYVRMCRSDYNPEMVHVFREGVKSEIVPIANRLYAEQKSRLGLENLEYYDEKFEFLTGNPKPQGDPAWILEQGRVMYNEMSKETNEFFNFMLDHDLLDLETKAGKAGGGYCTYIADYKSPYIFSNFNGTQGDVDVLTHEAGHAFQVYMSRNIEIPELNFPTYESCEIHSMSMEFFAYPWIDKFFIGDTEKYKYSHVGSAFKFIPYGVSVDKFQHVIYENPNMTPAERKEAWRNVEREFLPHKNYGECDFLERGGWFFQQAHIFNSPFYYIDYTLAQICALQFYKRMLEDRESAWNDYVRLCSIGGEKSFLGLVEYANLESPFKEGVVKNIVEKVSQELFKIDSSKL